MKEERLSGDRALTALILALLGFLAPPVLQAQRPGTATAAPNFTTEQAGEGRVLYAQQCASCHGANLSGGEFASALNGNRFSQDWGGKTADALFSFVRTRMPPAAPGSLSAEKTAQLVAFLVQVNGAQAGDTLLPTDVMRLSALTIVRGPTAPTPPMMPLSPLSPPIPLVAVANPLDRIAPVTDALLQQPPEGDWLLWRRTYDDQGFSPLKQIDRTNVQELRVVWSWSLPNGPNETTPLEHDGVLFVASFGDRVQALNAITGDLLWEYSRVLPSDAQPSVKRNLALYQDRLIVPTSDDHVVALDVKTGTVIWDAPLVDYQKGWRVTGGPLVAQGKVMQGVGKLSLGGGAVVALDVETGKEAWRFQTIPHPGELGGDSWNDLPYEGRSGASVWTAGSYDPQLKLAYFGVGQTYDTGPLLHPVHKRGISNDGLFTDSTLAFDPATGKLAWYFQHLHNDQWDLDWAFERQLIDLPVRGTQQRLVVTSGKMAIYEALEAANGHYIFSKDLGIQNVIAKIDPRNGDKTINPAVVVGDGKPHTICPHPGGGRNWIAGSYNADTKSVFVAMNETCMDLIPAPAGQRGNLTSGVNWSIRPRPDSDGQYGRVEAFNLVTRQVLWMSRQRAPQTTCTLDTAGGIVFAGALDRVLKAYDDESGRLLWAIRLNDVPNSCPISFAVNGRQYLAVVVGGGGSIPSTYPVLVPEIQNPPEHGAAIWVFTLPERQFATK